MSMEVALYEECLPYKIKDPIWNLQNSLRAKCSSSFVIPVFLQQDGKWSQEDPRSLQAS